MNNVAVSRDGETLFIYSFFSRDSSWPFRVRASVERERVRSNASASRRRENREIARESYVKRIFSNTPSSRCLHIKSALRGLRAGSRSYDEVRERLRKRDHENENAPMSFVI